MANRHQRRKAAAKRLEAKQAGLAQAERSRQVAAIVRKNKAAPIERNYYPQSVMGRLSETAVYGRVGSNIAERDFAPKGTVARGFNTGSSSNKVNGLWHPKSYK